MSCFIRKTSVVFFLLFCSATARAQDSSSSTPVIPPDKPGPTAARLEAINVRKGATPEAMRTMEERESKLGPEPPPEPKASNEPQKPPESNSSTGIPTPPDLTVPHTPNPAPTTSPPASTPSSSGIFWPAALGLIVLLAVVAVRLARRTPIS